MTKRGTPANGFHEGGFGAPMHIGQNFLSQTHKVQAPGPHSCVWQQASRQPLQVCSMAAAVSGRAATAAIAIQTICNKGSGFDME